MKKFIVILILTLIMSTGDVIRKGNTFSVQQETTNIQTPYTWQDKDGKVYPIYITKKGACYVKRISKKTGREYKYYLPKEVQKQIIQELNF